MKELKPCQQAWLQMAARISEGLSMPDAFISGEQNMTGRKTVFSSSGNMAFVTGLSANGLRATAWLGHEDFSANQAVLRQAVRNLQPVVVITDTQHAKPLMDTGAFLLHASNTQELIDFTLIAHHVAELALIPGVIAFDIEEKMLLPVMPDDNILLEYLGEADSRIATPTPAQQMLFGKSRRKIPRMFHTDIPVLGGAGKTARGNAYEAAAHQAFFSAHLDKFLEEAFEKFEKIFSRKHRAFYSKNTDRADLILLSDHLSVFEFSQGLRFKSRTGHVLLKQLSPFPSVLKKVCEKAGTIAVVEASAEGGALISGNLLDSIARKAVPVYTALYADAPTTDLVQEFVSRVEAKKIEDNPVWLDVNFFNDRSSFPKKQVLMQDVQREYPHLKNQIAGAKHSNPEKPIRMPKSIPLVLRRYKDHGPVYSRIAHFFDTTAFFYESNSTDWIADPFQAMPVMPPATAAFGQLTSGRTHVPVLNTSKCTGCGDCLMYCPHAAMPSLALNMEAFLQSGIQQAQAKGHIIAQLFPHIKNLAKAANKIIATLSLGRTKENKRDENGEQPALTLNDILTPAFDGFIKQTKLEGEKLDTIRREFHAILESIGTFRIVISDFFFNDAGKELFSLAIDPNSCTGCGICAEVCNDHALSMEAESALPLEMLNGQFKLWEQFPDTHGDTLQRLIDHPGYPSLAALLLSRNFYMSLTGASDQDGASAKTIIHLVTAVAEAMTQKGFSAMLKILDEKIEIISGNLKKELSNALPDLRDAGLAVALEKISTARLSIDELLEKRSEAGHARLLDKVVLQRKLELIKELEDLKELIVSGSGGTGRARYAIALDASLAELATFPVNSFTVPVICFEGSSFEMARGLIHGHLRHILDNIKVLRRAALEENNKYNPILHGPEIAALRWVDLSEEEKMFVPPLLLIARKTLLHHNSASELARLVDEGLPVKVIILDNANPSVDTANADILHEVISMIPFIGLDHVQVLQSSLAQPSHLFDGLISALGKPGSAVMRLLAPDSTHGHMQMLHSIACNSRAFIHFDYRPDRKEKLVFSKLQIHANPSPEAEWVSSMIHYVNGGEAKDMAYELTFADWIYAQQNRKSYFTQYHESMGEAMQVAAYIRLNKNDRKGKIPVIIRVNTKGELVRHAIAETITRQTETALHAWQLMREVAGEMAEFPEKVFAKAEQELSVKYEADKKNMIVEYEDKLKHFEEEYLEKMRAQIKAKLMGMAGTN